MQLDTTLRIGKSIEHSIYIIRGQKVMMDHDLAALYGVSTKALNQAVKRNAERFPEDFMFRLTLSEDSMRSQSVTASKRNVGALPYAFTEQGVAMLSGVLRSPRAIQVNVEIMRTFVKLRRLLSTNAHLARKLIDLEKKYDHHFRVVFEAIRDLMKDDEAPKRHIGFRPKGLP